jgi:hypothetical protein
MSCFPPGHGLDWRGWDLSTRNLFSLKRIFWPPERCPDWRGCVSFQQVNVLTEQDKLMSTRPLSWPKWFSCWPPGHSPDWRGWVAVHQITVLSEEGELMATRALFSLKRIGWPTEHCPEWRGEFACQHVTLLSKEDELLAIRSLSWLKRMSCANISLSWRKRMSHCSPGECPDLKGCIAVNQEFVMSEEVHLSANMSKSWLNWMSCSPTIHCPVRRE